MDPRTPVIVGIGTATDRAGTTPDVRLLMEAAAQAAAADAGRPDLLGRLDLVLVPRGTWQLADPGRRLAERFGAPARTLLAELGVLQTTLFARAVAAVAAGDADCTLVVGGEAAYSAKRGGAENRPLPGAGGEGDPPDEVIRPHGDIVSRLEIQRLFWTPAHQYALIERSLGRSPDELDRAWAACSVIAAGNPSAWRQDAVTPASLAWGSATNPPVAFPYGRRHCSQMNVDQAGAVLVLSVERARALGLPEDGWIFPHVVAESNLMVPLPQRAEPGRSPAFAALGAALREATGLDPAAVDAVDLYSCFPAAVEVQRRELALPEGRPLTVTGGMSFAGGPFNNYVLQSTARMVEVLRTSSARTGLVTAISGMITKQGLMLLADEPRDAGCEVLDVSDAAERATARTEIVAEPDAVESTGRVVTSTVVAGAEPVAWALVDLPDGRRTLVSSTAPDVVAAWSLAEAPRGPVEVRGAAFAPA